MSPAQCPICFGPLEVREVAPCMDCGHLPEELDHFRQGTHRYDELEVIDGQRLILCDFCQVDFGSYDPAYFGLSRGRSIGIESMRLIRRVHDLAIVRDKYCPACDRRLAFLEFLEAVRDQRQDRVKDEPVDRNPE